MNATQARKLEQLLQRNAQRVARQLYEAWRDSQVEIDNTAEFEQPATVAKLAKRHKELNDKIEAITKERSKVAGRLMDLGWHTHSRHYDRWVPVPRQVSDTEARFIAKVLGVKEVPKRERWRRHRFEGEPFLDNEHLLAQNQKAMDGFLAKLQLIDNYVNETAVVKLYASDGGEEIFAELVAGLEALVE